jgi:hypothetical protein
LEVKTKDELAEMLTANGILIHEDIYYEMKPKTEPFTEA